MFHPGPNHYDPAIDGSITPPPAFTSKVNAEQISRRELRGVVAGEITVEPYASVPARRIWPDEPNVGFNAAEMAFKLDGNLRLGGPTLKTYTLNNLSMLSRIRESLITMNDTYRKLQASEDQLEQADMLNAVGAWTTEDTAAATEALDIASTQIQSDARTYATPSADTIQILRRGVYLICYRVYCTADLGALELDLTVGSTAYNWEGTGLPTTLTVTEIIPYVKTDDAADSVQLVNRIGTTIGDIAPRHTALQIVKLR